MVVDDHPMAHGQAIDDAMEVERARREAVEQKKVGARVAGLRWLVDEEDLATSDPKQAAAIPPRF